MGCLGPVLTVFGQSWVVLKRSSGRFGAVLGPFWGSLGALQPTKKYNFPLVSAHSLYYIGLLGFMRLLNALGVAGDAPQAFSIKRKR